MIERVDVVELEFGERLRCLAVREQLIARMTGALPDPVFVSTEGEGARHEASAEAVSSEHALQRRGAREVGAVEFGVGEVTPHALRHVVDVEWPVVLVDKDERVPIGLALLEPALQCARHAGRELPPTRMVGLVLIERDRLVSQVDVLYLKRGRFGTPHALTMKEAVEDPELERDLRARE